MRQESRGWCSTSVVFLLEILGEVSKLCSCDINLTQQIVVHNSARLLAIWADGVITESAVSGRH